jgi:rhodanese-related sulfurtransferase
MKTISVPAFKEVLEAESTNDSIDFINVCTSAEYKERHIRGVRSVPLDDIESHIGEFRDKKTIFVHCRSGKRASQAIEKLSALGISAELVNVEGGQMKWEESGYETGSHTNRLPIIRQVFITAGILILLSTVLGYTVASTWFMLAGAVAVGLMVSGITGWCGMALLLAKMPWNK